MSIQTMSRVWEHSNLGSTQLLLLLAIADFSNDEGVAWPSVRTLARKIRMSERNTHYLLTKIIKTGELAIEKNKGPRGCNLFRVQILQGANLSGMQQVALGGAMDGAKGVQPTAPEPSVIRQRTASAIPSPSNNPKKHLFDLGVSILTQAGESEKAARTFLAKFAKQDEGKLAEVIGYLATNPKIEPKSYIAAAFKPEERGLVT